MKDYYLEFQDNGHVIISDRPECDHVALYRGKACRTTQERVARYAFRKGAKKVSWRL